MSWATAVKPEQHRNKTHGGTVQLQLQRHFRPMTKFEHVKGNAILRMTLLQDSNSTGEGVVGLETHFNWIYIKFSQLSGEVPFLIQTGWLSQFLLAGCSSQKQNFLLLFVKRRSCFQNWSFVNCCSEVVVHFCCGSVKPGCHNECFNFCPKDPTTSNHTNNYFRGQKVNSWGKKVLGQSAVTAITVCDTDILH